jgi:NAD(P)-dependent dehydrogenase (short-subunit alcohol dehydrogenase family)
MKSSRRRIRPGCGHRPPKSVGTTEERIASAEQTDIVTDINFTSRQYDPGLAYGQPKTANVLFAVEAARRWASDGITANAVQPGPVAATGLNPHLVSS